MRIYQLYYRDLDKGCLLEWFEKKGDAVKRFAELKAQGAVYNDGPSVIQAYDLPATVQGFVNWLNVHFTTDNG